MAGQRKSPLIQFPFFQPRRQVICHLDIVGFHAARVRGCAMIDEVFAPGMAAMAAPVFRRTEVIGVISLAGPRPRLDTARMHALAPALLESAAELGPISNASTLFGRPALGKG